MEKQKKNGKAHLLKGVFLLCVFTFLMIFFFEYNPLTVNNMDDWTYVAFRRAAVPSVNQWNPARVLPEILMPACAQLAVWLVLPVTGNYLMSLTIVFNTVLALFATLYIAMFVRLLMNLMNADEPMAVLLSALFFVFHIRCWMSPWIPSQHMFYSPSLTTAFYYTIPSLLNIILVLLLDSRREGDAVCSAEHPIVNGMLILLLYLAVFSNLYCSIILAVYCGVHAAWGFVKKLAKKTPFAAWAKEYGLHLCVLAAWFVSMGFELTGNRAGSLKTSTPLLDRLKQTVSVLLLEIERMEDTVFYLTLLMIAAGLVLVAVSRCRKEKDKAYAVVMLRYLCCAVLSLVYLILLSAMTNQGYIARKDVLIGPVFFVFAAAFCSLAYLIEKCSHITLAVPIVTFIMAFDVLLGINTFAVSNALMLPQKTCIAITESFVEKVLEADRAGLSEVTISVPRGSEAYGNWPYTHDMGLRMVTALESHRMIEHVKYISVEIDDQFFDHFSEN